MTADIIQFPPQGPVCKRCRGAITLTEGEEERDLCFCCQHNIPLPLGHACPDCGGNGWILTYARSDDGEGPKQETCMGCLGTGRK